MIRIDEKNKGAGKQGFLILEALLSVMIISASLMVVIHSLMMSARSSANNEHHFLAVLEHENKRFQTLTAKEPK